MKTVMIVDDATYMRLSLKQMIEKMGFVVVAEAVDGIEAVAKYNEVKPDIVTMDITMPNLDGLQSMKKILEINPAAVIIMITSMGMEIQVRESIANGAKGYIVKPLKEDTIEKTFARFK